MLNYVTTKEFDKDFKALQKRFRTLDKDFSLMKKFSLEPHYEQGTPQTAFVPIEGFCGERYVSNKVRKFSCMSIKGRGAASGIRIIFVWEEEKRQITFIEMYFKGDKENEDRTRLRNFISSL